MMKVIDRNVVNVIGQGEQVIMLAHGFGCDQQMWQLIIPYLESKYRIVMFDYVGSGRSDLSAYQKDKYNHLNGYVHDVFDIIEALNLKDIIFVGHSISSMIGMLASIQRPNNFKQLIMIGPSPCYINEDSYYGGFDVADIQELLAMMEMNFEGWATYLAQVVLNQPELTKSFAASDPVITRKFAEVTFFSDYRDQLHRVTVPTLIMQCSEDSIVPMEVGHYLHKNISGSELYLMKAKGHYPHISHPKETVEAILSFIL